MPQKALDQQLGYIFQAFFSVKTIESSSGNFEQKFQGSRDFIPISPCQLKKKKSANISEMIWTDSQLRSYRTFRFLVKKMHNKTV